MQKPNAKLNVGTVQAGKREVWLVAGQITTIFARARAGAQFRGERMLFTPCELPQLPEGLVIEEGLVRIDGDRAACVPIPIANTNKHDMTLSPRLTLGHLQEVKTVYAATTEPVPGSLEVAPLCGSNTNSSSISRDAVRFSGRWRVI